MTATAFEHLGRAVPGGWEFQCDGMPTLAGCSASVIVPRRWVRLGRKSTGWLVTTGWVLPEDDPAAPPGGRPEPDVVLAFCPDCARVVAAQDRLRPECTPGWVEEAPDGALVARCGCGWYAPARSRTAGKAAQRDHRFPPR